MRKLIASILLGCFVVGFLLGCSDSKKKNEGFMSSLGDCNVVYTQCINKCKDGPKLCGDQCEKARGMCNAIHVKGCMQQCNERYGKDSSSSEACKRNCQRK